MLSLSFNQCVILRKRFFIDVVERNSAVAVDGSGTMALIPKLFKAAIMDDGVITLSNDDQLADAICTGLLAVSSAQASGPVNLRDEPVIYEGIRSAILDQEGSVLDVLVRSSQKTAVFAKGGALEIAVAWHVALTCNKFKDPSLTTVLKTLGVSVTFIPPDLSSWIVRATRVHDDDLGHQQSCGAKNLSPFQRYFVNDDGSIDDSRVVYNIPVAQGGDVVFLVSRIAPTADGASDGGDIFGGRQYKLVVLQCKNDQHASVADTLLTLHPGTQFLQNLARHRLLQLPSKSFHYAKQAGWQQWEALARDAGLAFLTRNWVRIAVVARPVATEIPEFSLAAAVTDETDTHVRSWTSAQRHLAARSPVIWVSLFEKFDDCVGVFPDTVRRAIVAATVVDSEHSTNASAVGRPCMTLLHHELWIPASVSQAAELIAQVEAEAASKKEKAAPLAS